MLPFSGPNLRNDLPVYPLQLQLLRITSASVIGPSGPLYISSTQQLNTDTLTVRDREPCLAVPIPLGVAPVPGYYLCRLAGSFQNLPVYEVLDKSSSSDGGGSLPSGASGLPGLTLGQIQMLSASLTPLQIADLNNLDACQLQVLLQLPVVNIQLLSNLTPTQLQNVVDGLTYTQLSQIATQISTTQTLVISSAYPQTYQAINQLLTQQQALSILSNLSSQQISTLVSLTPTQLQVVAQLTLVQLQLLTSLTAAQVTTLVGQLTTTQISSILTTFSTAQTQQLTNNLSAVQIQQLLQVLTSSQLATLITNLTPTQLLVLVKYPSATIAVLVLGLSIVNLGVFLNITGPPPSPILGNSTYFPMVPGVVGHPSSVPAPIPGGYTPVVIDISTGGVWWYFSGTWNSTNIFKEDVSYKNLAGTTYIYWNLSTLTWYYRDVNISIQDTTGGTTYWGWNKNTLVLTWYGGTSNSTWTRSSNTWNFSAGVLIIPTAAAASPVQGSIYCTGTFLWQYDGSGYKKYAPSPLTTKGDIWGFSTLDVRIPVGSDGQTIIADSSQAAGWRWGAGGSGSVSFGAVTQIPFTNAGATDFDYEAAFTYASGSNILDVGGTGSASITVGNTSGQTGIIYLGYSLVLGGGPTESSIYDSSGLFKIGTGSGGNSPGFLLDAATGEMQLFAAGGGVTVQNGAKIWAADIDADAITANSVDATSITVSGNTVLSGNVGPGAGTYTTGLRLTPLGTDGSITLDAQGRVTAITQAT